MATARGTFKVLKGFPYCTSIGIIFEYMYKYVKQPTQTHQTAPGSTTNTNCGNIFSLRHLAGGLIHNGVTNQGTEESMVTHSMLHVTELRLTFLRHTRNSYYNYSACFRLSIHLGARDVDSIEQRFATEFFYEFSWWLLQKLWMNVWLFSYPCYAESLNANSIRIKTICSLNYQRHI